MSKFLKLIRSNQFCHAIRLKRCFICSPSLGWLPGTLTGGSTPTHVWGRASPRTRPRPQHWRRTGWWHTSLEGRLSSCWPASCWWKCLTLLLGQCNSLSSQCPQSCHCPPELVCNNKRLTFSRKPLPFVLIGLSETHLVDLEPNR